VADSGLNCDELSDSATRDLLLVKLSLFSVPGEGLHLQVRAQLTCVPYSGDPWLGPQGGALAPNDPVRLTEPTFLVLKEIPFGMQGRVSRGVGHNCKQRKPKMGSGILLQ
jgi:hypothetical protein